MRRQFWCYEKKRNISQVQFTKIVQSRNPTTRQADHTVQLVSLAVRTTCRARLMMVFVFVLPHASAPIGIGADFNEHLRVLI